MPSKPRNFSPPPEMLHDSGSPDPIDTIPRPESRQSLSDSADGVDSDPSPSDRALKGRRIVHQPPLRGQSDEEWSPPISRRVNLRRTVVQSPEDDGEEDFPGVVPGHRASTADASVGRKLDFEAVSSGSDAEDATSAAMPHATGIPAIPRPPSPDVFDLFGKLDENPSSVPHSSPVSSPKPQTQSEESSAEDEDTPLIPPLPSRPPPRVWHSADEVGAVLVPVRDDRFPSELQDAERTMASQIASALSDPGDEGLGSATFQTLLDTFLLPRLKGRNSKGQKVRVHQYSQFAAQRGQEQSATAREHAKQDVDMLARMYKLEKEDAAVLNAIAQRRIPDMTSMAVFEEEVLTPDGLNYRLECHRGPKLCITEIKSFDWSGDHRLLDHVLSVAVSKGHKQNYVAAQFLFMEDEHLKQVASFVGVGPVWCYGEWYRSHYHDLYGMPLPRNPTEVKRYQERTAVETPDGKTVGTSRKRLRVYSPDSEGDSPEQPDVADSGPAAALPVRRGPNTRAVVRSGQPEAYLPRLGSQPWTVPEHIQDIFTRRRPGERVKPKQSGPQPLPYLYVLDPEGRTYEAFDAITERIRGWHTGEECHPEYRITFDKDPYAGGSCPATAAKLKGKARG